MQYIYRTPDKCTVFWRLHCVRLGDACLYKKLQKKIQFLLLLVLLLKRDTRFLLVCVYGKYKGNFQIPFGFFLLFIHNLFHYLFYFYQQQNDQLNSSPTCTGALVCAPSH